MAGVPDRSLEKRVAALLQRKDMQDTSDREVARKAKCGKNFVRVVRAKLIAWGKLKPPASPNMRSDGYNGGPVQIRGGYVLDPTTGKTVRDSHYRPPKKKPAGRATRKKKP